MDHTFDKDYWDEIWSGDRGIAMSSSEPNPHLVREVRDLRPGSALDAGCGAGAEAIWLAAHGWTVTAADVAAAALQLGEERAAAAGIGGQVQWVQADLSTWMPSGRYDLVTTHYAHPKIPQLEFYERIASWVAPQGTLLVVGHLHGLGQRHTHPPAAASVTASSITELLDPGAWEIVTAEESQRTMASPGGQPITIHDAVVRAKRLR